MSTSGCIDRRARRQRGDALIEALISMLLVSVVGLGLVYSTSRVAVSHKDMNLQAMAVSQMRNLLQNHGSGTIDLCNPKKHQIELSANLKPMVTTHGCDKSLTATVEGKDITLGAAPLWLSVELPKEHGGGEIVVGGLK
ncbi:hypothetical protein D3C78_580190 [compost metagenome]